ncbi:MAG TPA: hypothetical protein VEZ42_04065, partial [Pseudonocardia sp.]|nr:hypothetical protein [Pseudonocardia sp.]
MDLTAALLRAGARRPHVLVAPAPGGTAVRLRVEAELAHRGWPAAAGPADADVLVVAGAAGPALAAVVDEVWRAVPAPRARTAVLDPGRVPSALDAAVRQVADAGHQRRTAPAGSRPGPPVPGEHATAHAGHRTDQDQHQPPPPEGHGGHHAHHGQHGGMALPGGRVLAGLGPDRDGLTLDRLHVPLGPLLPDWPAGLVLRVTLQGDVVQEAAAEVLDADRAVPFWTPATAAARELDGLGRFLAVAGWADAAARSRRLRDDLLAGTAVDGGVAARLTHRVRRSRTLKWLVRGMPAGPADVLTVLHRRLDAVDAALAGDPAAPV